MAQRYVVMDADTGATRMEAGDFNALKTWTEANPLARTVYDSKGVVGGETRTVLFVRDSAAPATPTQPDADAETRKITTTSASRFIRKEALRRIAAERKQPVPVIEGLLAAGHKRVTAAFDAYVTTAIEGVLILAAKGTYELISV